MLKRGGGDEEQRDALVPRRTVPPSVCVSGGAVASGVAVSTAATKAKRSPTRSSRQRGCVWGTHTQK